MTDLPALPSNFVPAAGPSRWRRLATIALVVISCLAVASANVAIWARQTTLDTDTWTENARAIFDDDDVLSALTDYLVDRVLEVVDIEDLAGAVLPAEFDFVAGALDGAARTALREVIGSIVRQPGAGQAVDFLNREAHELAVPILTGQNEYIRIDGDDLVVDLDPVLGGVADQLRDWGLPVPDDFESDGREIAVLTSPELGEAKQAVDRMNTLRWALPLLALLAGAGAIALSARRLRALSVIGYGTVISAWVFVGLEAVVSRSALAGLTDPIVKLLGESLWDIASGRLVVQTVVVTLVALAVGAGAGMAARLR